MADAHSTLMTTIAQAWTGATRQHNAHMYDYALHNISRAIEELEPADPPGWDEVDGTKLPRITWAQDHKRDYRKHES